jgi:hypothetical protein
MSESPNTPTVVLVHGGFGDLLERRRCSTFITVSPGRPG